MCTKMQRSPTQNKALLFVPSVAHDWCSAAHQKCRTICRKIIKLKRPRSAISSSIHADRSQPDTREVKRHVAVFAPFTVVIQLCSEQTLLSCASCAPHWWCGTTVKRHWAVCRKVTERSETLANISSWSWMQVSPGVSALIARPQRLGLNTCTRIWTSAACPTGSASSVSTVSTLCSSRICHFACSGMSSWATISKDVARADLTACRQMFN